VLDGATLTLAAPIREYAVYTLNAQGFVSGWSANATDFFGFGADEVMGTHFSRFFIERESTAGKAAQLLHLASQLGNADYAGRQVRKNGSNFRSHITIMALRDRQAVLLGFTSFVRDVTLRGRPDDLEAQDYSLLHVAHQAVLVRDLDGRITFWTEGAQSLYQWSPQEAVGCFSHELFRTSSSTPLEEIAEHTRRNNSWDGRLFRRRKDGALLVVESHWELQCGDGGVASVIVELDRDVTQDLATDQSYSQSKRLLSEGFEHAVIGMGLVALDGRWIRVNSALANMLGYSPKELTTEADFDDGIHPCDPGFSDEERGALIAGEINSCETEKRFLRKNGDSLWGFSTVSLVRDSLHHPLYFIVQIQDVTERRNTAQALAEQRKLLEAIVENMGSALFVVDPKGTVLFFNQAARSLFGDPGFVPPEKVPEVYGLYHPDQHTHFEYGDLPLYRTLSGEMVAEQEIWVRNGSVPNGAWIQVVTRPLRNEDGSLRGAIVVARDVTVQKRMENQMECSRAQIAASARMSALGMMAGSIAHEINNPLAIIHAGASNLLEMSQAGDIPLSSVVSNANQLVRTAERITKIIASLRHLSRHGNADPFLVAPIHQVIDHALDLSRERFKMRAIALRCRPIDTLIEVRCREVQISQILLNLLQNALDAVDSIDRKKIVTIEVKRRSAWVEVAVMDNGPGFSTEAKRSAMDPFFTTKPVGKGTGLGLTISNSIAEGHGGRLEISEREGQTCVSLLLPLNEKP
jgi:PAS domain S-box-containing protein